MERSPLARATAVAAVAFVVAIVAFLSPGDSAAAAETDDLIGTVIDAETKKPVVGALVSVWRRTEPAPVEGLLALDDNWPAQAARSAKTDARGAFSFVKEPRAPIRWLSVTAAGYAAAAVPADDGAAAQIPLAKLAPTKIRVLWAGADAGLPAAGVEVLVLAPESRLLAARIVTGADGAVSVPSAPGETVLTMGPGVASMRTDLPESGGTLYVRPGGPVAGTVTTPAGAPVAGAEVRLGFGRVTTTDVTGRFQFQGVSCRGQSIVVSARGFAPVTRPVAGGESEIRVVVAPGARVRGRVVDTDGKPRADVEITHDSAARLDILSSVPEEPPDDFVVTGLDGKFELVDVSAGLRTIRASGADVGDGETVIDVRPGVAPPDVTVVVRTKRPRLPVRVLDAAGAPLGGVQVAGGAKSPLTRTGPDGACDVPLDLTPKSADAIVLMVWGSILGADPVFVAIPRDRVCAGRVDLQICPSVAVRVQTAAAPGALAPLSQPLFSVLPADGAPVPVWKEVREFTTEPGVLRLPAGCAFRLLAFGERDTLVWTELLTLQKGRDHTVKVEFGPAPIITIPVPPDMQRRAGGLAEPADGPDERFGRDVVMWRPTKDSFEFSPRTAGRWHVTLEAEVPLCTVHAFRTETVTRAGEVIRMPPIDTKSVVRVSGVVKRGGKPVPGADLSIELAPGIERTLNAEPDGRFAFQIPAGLEVRVIARPHDCGWAAQHAGGAPGKAPLTALTFDLPEAANVVIVNLSSPFGFVPPVEVRSAGVTRKAEVRERSNVAIVRGVAPGAVEVVVGEGKTARTIRVDAPAGKTTFVDLATAK